MDATASHNERTTVAGPAWFNAVVIAGTVLAAVVLVNSVVNYVWMTPRILAAQIRREMNRVVQSLDHQIREVPSVDAASLRTLLGTVRRNEADLAWIEVRSRTQGVLAHAGINAGVSMTQDEIAERIRRREPVAVTRNLPGGDVVVELFPFRLPDGEGGKPGFAQVEIAMWADGARSALWPVRKNLIINCTAACALLVSLITMRLRMRSYLLGRRLEDELRIAREVQRALLPSTELSCASVSASSECVPASGIAGDLHDLFETPDGRVAVVCGDVAGKGIPAALLMGVIHGAVRSVDWFKSPADHEAAARRLNRLLCDRASDARFASLFWGYYDPASETLHYVNAGHCPGLLIRPWRETAELQFLGDGGPVLGLLPGARYEQAKVDLCPGDLLLLYSDGVIEATDAAGQEFGEERLCEVVRRNASRSPAEIRTAVLDAVRDFAGSTEFSDDLTLMAVLFRPDDLLSPSDAVLEAREVLVG